MERVTATNPIEVLSSKVAVSEALGPKLSSVEAMPTIPMALRSLRLKQTMEKDKQPAMKEK